MRTTGLRPLILLLVSATYLIASVAFRLAAGPRQTDDALLLPGYQFANIGDKLKRELASGDAFHWGITLEASEYMRLAISQIEGCIAVSILDPTGARIVVVPVLEENPTFLSFASSLAGQYTVQITSHEAGPVVVRFELGIDDRRPIRKTDHIRISAERNCLEAEQLKKLFTPDSDRRAILKLKEALRFSTGIKDVGNVARILCRLGDLLQERSRSSEALSNYEQSLNISQEAKNQSGIADALARIGLIQVQTLGGQSALGGLERALKLSRETGNLRAAALSLTNIGEAHYFMGRQREALGYYQEAAELWRAVGERRGLAVALHSLGCTSSDLSEVSIAFKYFEQALELWRRIGDRHGEALTLTQLAESYSRVGEKQEAIDQYRRASEFFPNGADPFGEAMLMSASAYTYYSLGDLDSALDYYKKALLLYRAGGFRDGEAGQLMRIGQVYFHRGEYPAALEHMEKSLAIYRQIQDQRLVAVALYNIGRVQRSMGDFERAVERLNEALSLPATSDNLRYHARILDELGLAYGQIGEARKSVDYLLEALTLNRRAQEYFGEVQIRYDLARAFARLNNPVEAQNQTEESIKVVESLRTKVDVPSLRVSYFSTIRLNYDLYIDLLMDSHRNGPTMGQDVSALQVSERARARNLLDLLGESRSGIRQGIQASLSEREKELLRSLNAKAQGQAQLMSGKHTQEDADKLATEIRALNIEYDQLQAEIRKSNPRYAALTQPQPLSMREIQESVLDEKTLLLEYSLGDEHSYLWAVTKTGMTSHELPSRDKIEGLARKVRELLTVRQQRPAGETASQFFKRALEADAEYWKLSADLSRILLGPVAGQIEDRRLLVVTDGILQYLPFAALPWPGSNRGQNPPENQQVKPVPLIALNEVVSLPSASTLGVLRRQIQGRKPAEMGVAVLADPVFQRDDPRLIPVATSLPVRKGAPRAASGNGGSRGAEASAAFPGLRNGAEYSRLLFSGREGRDIASTVQAGSVTLWAGFEASRARATSNELSRYRIVHFATHGVIDDSHPNLSGIVLSKYDAKGREQDGFLRLHDIYNLNLPAELVVLSACNTGLGKDVRGEGFIGLVRGFMYAGAARVVASLWPVDDQSTAELMKRFYRGMLQEGLSPAAALRAAQVEMSKHERWSAPYYWAGFVLQGEYK